MDNCEGDRNYYQSIEMNPPRDFIDLVGIFIELVMTALPVITGLAFLVFLWGLAKFIFRVGGSGGEKAMEEGKSLMKWGLIALFILLSSIAIIAFIYRDIGFSGAFGFPFLPPNR